VAAGEVLAPCSCDVVAVGGALDPCGRIAVEAVESLLMSPCFRKRAESRRHHGARGAPSLFVFTWSVRALGRARRRLLRGRGRVCLLRSRSSPSPWVGRDGDRRLRPRSSPSPGSGEAEFVVFRGRGRVRALGRARRSSSSSGAEAESEP
jgi:hypothetical protein